jgi:hypothetical protein
MKKTILLLLVPFLGLAQTNKLDETNGFNNYVFGSSPTQHQNLTLEIDEGNTKLYTQQNPVKLNGVEFEYVRVTFCRNKLSAITFQTKNSTGLKFLNTLKENYGEPNTSNQFPENYEWLSKKVELFYEKDGSNKDAVISFYSKEIYKNKN